jgi:HupE/UreJ protein
MRIVSAMVVALALIASSSEAHVTSTGLATVTVDGATVRYQLTLVTSELPASVATLLDAAGAGEPSAVDRVATLLKQRVVIGTPESRCRPGRIAIQASRLGDHRMNLEMSVRCASEPRVLILREEWFDVLGSHHRTLARVERGDVVRVAALSEDAPEARIELGGIAQTPQLGFLLLGVEHILTGYDHLLFLAALILGSGAMLSLLTTITAFTVAHSITLAVAVLGVITVPDRLVEALIAASIVWVAVSNLAFRSERTHRWLVTFAFGLVHGFGFASALTPLALPRWNLALALLGFNVGIEIGQALVVAAALPLLLLARHRGWEPRVARVASLALAIIGVLWLVQRIVFA